MASNRARRQRADTVAAAVSTMIAAQREIVPPAHVRMDEGDAPFWRSVIAEFARSEWTDHQLELAAMLARAMADMEREQFELRGEGSVMATDRGTPVVNPRKAVVQMLSSTILSIRRSLSLHARAQGGEARDVAKRRGIAKGVEAANVLDDELIARPRLQ